MDQSLKTFLNTRLDVSEAIVRDLASGIPLRWEVLNTTLASAAFNGLFAGKATGYLADEIQSSCYNNPRNQVHEYLGRFTGWLQSTVGNFVKALDLMQRYELANKIRVAAGVAPVAAPIITESPPVLLHELLDNTLHQELVRALGSGGAGISARWWKVGGEMSKLASYNNKLNLTTLQDIEVENSNGPLRAAALLALLQTLRVTTFEFIGALRGALLDNSADSVEKALLSYQPSMYATSARVAALPVSAPTTRAVRSNVRSDELNIAMDDLDLPEFEEHHIFFQIEGAMKRVNPGRVLQSREEAAHALSISAKKLEKHAGGTYHKAQVLTQRVAGVKLTTHSADLMAQHPRAPTPKAFSVNAESIKQSTSGKTGTVMLGEQEIAIHQGGSLPVFLPVMQLKDGSYKPVLSKSKVPKSQEEAANILKNAAGKVDFANACVLILGKSYTPPTIEFDESDVSINID